MGDVQIDLDLFGRVAGEIDDDRADLARANHVSEPDTGVPLDGLDDGSFSLSGQVTGDVQDLLTWLRHRHAAAETVIRTFRKTDHASGRDFRSASKTLAEHFDDGIDDRYQQ